MTDVDMGFFGQPTDLLGEPAGLQGEASSLLGESTGLLDETTIDVTREEPRKVIEELRIETTPQEELFTAGDLLGEVEEDASMFGGKDAFRCDKYLVMLERCME